MAVIREIRTRSELDQMLEESRTRPVFIFKHSQICPISTKAFDQYEAFAREQADDFTLALIMIRDHRDLSNEITAYTGVKHESPQAILLINGKAVWDDSHFEITKEKLKQVVMMYEDKAFTNK